MKSPHIIVRTFLFDRNLNDYAGKKEIDLGKLKGYRLLFKRVKIIKALKDNIVRLFKTALDIGYEYYICV